MTPMRFKLPTKAAIAATLAASLALTPMTATPAQAGNQDQAGAIAAASLFALITAGIIASTANQGKFTTTAPARGRSDGRDRGGRNQTRVDPRKQLPQQCEFTVRRGRDKGTYYGSLCLKRNFDYWAYLPDRCEEKAWVPRRNRNVNAFDASCLARFGYREEDRSRSSRR